MISLYEEATIRASLEVMQNPKFQCPSKESDLETRYSLDSRADVKIQHALTAHALINSCDEYQDKVVHTLDRFGYNSCLCNYSYSLIYYFSILLENYEKGNLPFEGSISDQPSRVIDIIYLIQALKQEYKQKLQKEQTKG